MTERVTEMLSRHVGRRFQFTMSGRDALEMVLADIGVTHDDVITIIPSIGNFYVSSCVTKTIEKHCKWSMTIERESRALLVIHEWGVVHRDLPELRKYGLPIIEDCAYAFSSRTGSYQSGAIGDYAIYSLGKFFSVNLGGLACGLQQEGRGVRDDVVQFICSMLYSADSINSIVGKRIDVWKQMSSLFAAIGAPPAYALESGDVPGVFMFQVHDSIEPEAVKSAYGEHGIECSVYYGSRNVFVPCHQGLGRGSVQYIFDVYEDMVRDITK
jgi:hypothetical protein